MMQQLVTLLILQMNLELKEIMFWKYQQILVVITVKI